MRNLRVDEMAARYYAGLLGGADSEIVQWTGTVLVRVAKCACVSYIFAPVVAPAKLLSHLQRALAFLPIRFEQLVFLTSLRDAYTGRYLHEGWISVASAGDVHRALQQSHHEIFSLVLRLPLVELCRQLRSHFESLGEKQPEAEKIWLEIEPFREMVPQGSSPVERSLFVSQVRVALEVLVRDPGWVGLEEQGASPAPPPDPQLQPHWLN